ncbi:MAG: Gfo/Idh/MocA family oxidoreductase [Burkholderiales bacterium]|nr:Gfo/Idh/MocA family oxidoreductase [Burkholderiales bacterium]
MPEPQDPLRLGILGCARIAGVFCHHVASGPAPSRQVRVVAVASRRAETAAAFAATHGIARHHGSYEALLADREVDAVYLPLPNSLHAEWAVHAAEAGKHVLCEKPLALSRAEAQAMFGAARKRGVMLLEGYPYWFQPQTADMVSLLEAGAIGRVRSVHAGFGFMLASRQGNIRMNPELGGGALLDAGSYPLSLIRLVMGEAPVRVRADASWSGGAPGAGVDTSASATLFYADGRRALMSCAMDVATYRRATVLGEAGVIETEYLNHTSEQPRGDAFGHLTSQLRVRRGTANHLPFEEVRSATGSGFRFAAEAFARVVAERDFEAIERAAAASLDIAATLEALAVSARRGVEVAVAQH